MKHLAKCLCIGMVGGIACAALAGPPAAAARSRGAAAAAAAGVTVTVTNCPAVDPPFRTDGMRAYVDPATGRLTDAPSPAEQAKLSARAPSASTEAHPIAVTHYRNGMVSAEIPPDMLDYMVVGRTPDGRLVKACVPGKAQANEAVKKGVAAPAAEEK